MSLIDKVGTYLGYAPIHGMGVSSGGYPQLELQCEATHFYDEEVGDYVEVTDQELRAFLVLYGKNQKPLRNNEQVKKVFGWDGSFPKLATMDLSGTRFLFRVKENVWEGDTNYKVDWINVDTASPTSQISSLDVKDLQALDVKYGIVTAGKKGVTKPKPTGKPSPPKTSTEKTTAKNKASTKKTETKTATEAIAPAPTTGPPIPVTKTEEKKTGSTTREAAWEYIAESIPVAALSDEDRAVAWIEAIEKIHGGPDDETLTPEEWFAVQELVLSENLPF